MEERDGERRGIPTIPGCAQDEDGTTGRRDETGHDFSIAFEGWDARFAGSIGPPNQNETVNSELCRLALAKVGNPNVLVNLVSRRVRQLNSGGGSLSRPLFRDTAGLGAADIALREIIEDKMGWDMPEEINLVEPAPKKRRKRS